MSRHEFEELAGIGRTTFFSTIDDPAVRAELEYAVGPSGQAEMHRGKALAFISRLRKVAAARAAERRQRLAGYASNNPPKRGRPCPHCRKRITRKRCVCRHCGIPVPPTADRE